MFYDALEVSYSNMDINREKLSLTVFFFLFVILILRIPLVPSIFNSKAESILLAYGNTEIIQKRSDTGIGALKNLLNW